MHLILTGATGLVGSGCLHAMLTNNAVTAVTVLSRRAVPMAEGHEKVHVIIHDDFSSYPPEFLEKLKGAEGCVWALGVSANEVDSEKYSEITKGFPLAAARAFATLADPFRFVYVSGEGATTEPGAFTPRYGKVKGEAEKALLELSKTIPSLKLYSARPAAVDATFHKEIHSFMPQQKQAMIRAGNFVLLPVFRACYKKMVSPTKELGQVLVELALRDGSPLEGEGVLDEGRTISNVGIRRLAGI